MGYTFIPTAEMREAEFLNITAYYGGSIIGACTLQIQTYNNSTYKEKLNIKISGMSYSGNGLNVTIKGDYEGYAITGSNSDCYVRFSYFSILQ